MKNKTIGCGLLITGTSVGAGMMALPLAAGSVGFMPALLMIILIWALMTYTGLLVLEVNLTLPNNTNFSSMAEQTAGPFARLVAWICVICLLYSLTGAYISGGASLFNLLLSYIFSALHLSVSMTNIVHLINAIIFTLLLGAVVWHSTEAVDAVNRTFISLKVIFLIITISLMLPVVHRQYLAPSSHSTLSILKLAPIFLACFGYHTIIPSLTKYRGKQARSLKRAIIFGTTLPLVLYISWLVCTLGIIPAFGPLSFATLHHTHSVAQLTQILLKHSNNNLISIGINAFANIALVTSFLGVTLGLLDFILDAFKLPSNRKGRLIGTTITLAPPLLFYMIDPHCFFTALKVAAFFIIILEIFLPAWMAHRIREKVNIPSYRAPGGKWTLYGCYAISAGLIIISILSLIH
jgi:tyrosine-specific transport protein